MSVSNGQLANQTTFNNAFLSRTTDTSTVGQIDLLDTETESGSSVENIQRAHNAISNFTGMPLNSDKDVLPEWEENNTGTVDDTLQMRSEALDALFHGSSGHTHDGSNGDGSPVLASSISTVRLRGTYVRGVNMWNNTSTLINTSVTGSSVNVSTLMAGKSVSTDQTVKGVVVDAPNNKIILREQNATGRGDMIRSSVGDLVFGRLTYAASVWTLSFYTDIAGTETAYSLTAQDVQWYYQELFNPITDAPVYSEIAFVPSDNATQDIVDATASQRGLVSTGGQSIAGVKTFTDTTQSTTKDTGAIITEGGLGVEKNINAGGDINAVGKLTAADTTQSTTKDTGALVIEGGLGVEKNANIGGNLVATGTAAASNLSGTNTGDITLGTLGTAPNAKGATLASQVLTLQPADDTHAGLMDILAQSFAGVKTWVAGAIHQAYIALQRRDENGTATVVALGVTKSYVKLTSGGTPVTQISTIAAGVDGQYIEIYNNTGASVTIKDQSAALGTAADRIVTATAGDMTLTTKTAAAFRYDAGQSRWVIASGSGSGGSTPTIFGTRTGPRSVVAATGITTGASHMSSTAPTQNIYVKGSVAGDSVAATISDGTIDGQEMTLIGASDTDTMSLSMDTTTNIYINGDFTFYTYKVMKLLWNGADWVEISRN